MENEQKTTPENVIKAKQAIEVILQEQKVNLVPIIIHRGEQTFATIDVVPVGEAPAAS